MRMTFTLGLSVLIKVFVIAPLVLATVSLDMTVLHASARFVLTIAMIEELAGLRSYLPPRLVAPILSLGML